MKKINDEKPLIIRIKGIKARITAIYRLIIYGKFKILPPYKVREPIKYVRLNHKKVLKGE